MDLLKTGLLDGNPLEVQGTTYDSFPVSPLLIVPQVITPSLELNFATGKQLDSRITFTRGSSATFTNASGLVETAASGVARFTHDPSTLASLGLLIEESRTNLLTYSEQIENAAWTATGGTASANQTSSPSGETTADLFTENSAASTQHRVFQSPTLSNATAYTASVFVKRASGTRNFGIIISYGGAIARVYFDLGAGTVATVVSGSGTITAYPGGWYRCTATGTTAATSGSVYFQMCNGTASGSETYTGDGSSGVYLWGAQLEAGAFGTSYIPTDGTVGGKTRAAEVAQMTGTNFSNWFNATEGTFVVSARPLDITTATIFTADDNGVNNRIYIQRESSLSIARGAVATSGSTVASLGISGISTTLNAALAYKQNDFAFSANGSAVSTDTTGNVPTVDRLRFGVAPVGGFGMFGPIARFRYFPRRLPDANIKILTT